ncbi:hypothetical protein BKA93DRAFT_877488 [Sparassis latifolia]
MNREGGAVSVFVAFFTLLCLCLSAGSCAKTPGVRSPRAIGCEMKVFRGVDVPEPTTLKLAIRFEDELRATPMKKALRPVAVPAWCRTLAPLRSWSSESWVSLECPRRSSSMKSCRQKPAVGSKACYAASLTPIQYRYSTAQRPSNTVFAVSEKARQYWTRAYTVNILVCMHRPGTIRSRIPRLTGCTEIHDGDRNLTSYSSLPAQYLLAVSVHSHAELHDHLFAIRLLHGDELGFVGSGIRINAYGTLTGYHAAFGVQMHNGSALFPKRTRGGPTRQQRISEIKEQRRE